MLPTLSPELTKAERLPVLTGKLSGEVVTVDRGWLAELVAFAAAAVGAVERGNLRAAGVKAERRCTAAILAGGTPPAECPR